MRLELGEELLGARAELGRLGVERLERLARGLTLGGVVRRRALALGAGSLAVEERVDRVGDEARARGAVVAIGRETGDDERVERRDRRKVPRALAREHGDGSRDQTLQDAREAVVLERPRRRRRSRGQHDAEGEDVGARVDPFTEGLLGRHVAGASGDGERDVSRGQRAAELAVLLHERDAPVEHVDLAELADHDVLRLQIPVNDAAAVRVVDGEAHLSQNAEHLRERRLRAVRRGVVVEDRAEGAALDDAHRVARLGVALGGEVVDRDDRRMLELRADLRLGDEVVGASIVREARLAGDGPPEHAIEDQEIHAPHPAAPDLAHQGVALALRRARRTNRRRMRERKRDLPLDLRFRGRMLLVSATTMVSSNT